MNGLTKHKLKFPKLNKDYKVGYVHVTTRNMSEKSYINHTITFCDICTKFFTSGFYVCVANLRHL